MYYNSTTVNADNLKELYSRAQGEVSIREALRELDLWGAGANFSLTGYMDSAAKELSIIKDWKELVNQVSAYPGLVYIYIYSTHSILCFLKLTHVIPLYVCELGGRQPVPSSIPQRLTLL